MARAERFFIGWAAYFAVTGLLGLCALSPTILTMSVWLLVLPAILLTLGANLFCWGWLFFAAALLGRGRSAKIKIGVLLCAAAALVALLVAIPERLNTESERIAADLVQQDKSWDGSLTGIKTLALLGLQGTGSRRASATPCSQKCLSLLYSGAVDAVTVGNAPSFDQGFDPKQAVTRYHIEHRASCVSLRGAPPAILLRLAAGDCLAGDRDTLAKADAAWIVTGQSDPAFLAHRLTRRRSLWTRTGTDWAEVYRTTAVEVVHYIVPLLLAPMTSPHRTSDANALSLQLLRDIRPLGGVEIDADSLEWAEAIPGLPAEAAAAETDARKSMTAVAAPDGAAVAATIDALNKTLADPSALPTASGFALVTPYLRAVTAGAQPDFDLLARIIRDQRVRDLTELGFLVNYLKQDAVPLAKPLLDRAMISPAPKGRQATLDVNVIGAFLDLPPCAAKPLRAQLEQLSADPEMRYVAAPMFARLADFGPSAIPELVAFIEEGTLLYLHPRPHSDDMRKGGPLVDAGLDGLAILGAGAKGAAATVAALLSDSAELSDYQRLELFEKVTFTMVRMDAIDELRAAMPTDRRSRTEYLITRALAAKDRSCR